MRASSGTGAALGSANSSTTALPSLRCSSSSVSADASWLRPTYVCQGYGLGCSTQANRVTAKKARLQRIRVSDGLHDTGAMRHSWPPAQHAHDPNSAPLYLGTERPRAEGPSLQLRAVQSCVVIHGAGAHDGEVDA